MAHELEIEVTKPVLIPLVGFVSPGVVKIDLSEYSKLHQKMLRRHLLILERSTALRVVQKADLEAGEADGSAAGCAAALNSEIDPAASNACQQGDEVRDAGGAARGVADVGGSLCETDQSFRRRRGRPPKHSGVSDA